MSIKLLEHILRGRSSDKGFGFGEAHGFAAAVEVAQRPVHLCNRRERGSRRLFCLLLVPGIGSLASWGRSRDPESVTEFLSIRVRILAEKRGGGRQSG